MNDDARILLDLSDLSGDPTPIPLADLIRDNIDARLDDAEVEDIRRTDVGGTAYLSIGGGAVMVRRLS